MPSINTIYFGGGTPSLLSVSELGNILRLLSDYFDLSQVHEMTLEANPEQLTAEYCRGLRALGFNRLSIGVQSFQDPVLRFMGRRHTAEEAMKAVDNAAAAFDNLSIDLRHCPCQIFRIFIRTFLFGLDRLIRLLRLNIRTLPFALCHTCH